MWMTFYFALRYTPAIPTVAITVPALLTFYHAAFLLTFLSLSRKAGDEPEECAKFTRELAP